jgi:uncharacterized protein (TIGR03083 family)
VARWWLDPGSATGSYAARVILTPRYDGPPALRVESAVGDLSVPLLRQRRRLGSVLAELDAGQWERQSRCHLWSVREVVAHLVRTNQMWRFSITAGLAGTPTVLMRSFDPAAGPPRQVEAMRDWSPARVLDAFVTTTEELAEAAAGLTGDAWSAVGESPLGHVGLDVVVLHALWDSWTHERDALLPLGITPPDEPDEVLACLCYTAGLGPALLACSGSTRRGAVAVTATDPAARLVVEAGPTVVVRDGPAPDGALHLTGPATQLVEGLSLRAPLTVDVPPADRWLLTGVTAAFSG